MEGSLSIQKEATLYAKKPVYMKGSHPTPSEKPLHMTGYQALPLHKETTVHI